MSDSFDSAPNMRAALASAFLTRPAVIDMLPNAAYACDAHGRLLWFNQRAADAWARVPHLGDDECCCASYQLLRRDGSFTYATEAPVARVLRTRSAARNHAVCIVRADGSSITVLMQIDPVMDAVGELLGGINCFHEIDTADDANAAERRACELLGTLPAAVYIVDREGWLTFFNAAAAELWGVTPTLGTNRWCGSWRLYSANGAPLPHDECPVAQVVKHGRALAATEVIAERPDGTRVPFLAHPSLLTDASGEIIGAVNMMLDITERKRAEERQRGLVDGFNHYAQNTLSTVQSIAALILHGANLDAEVRAAFDGRLSALTRAHDQLYRGQWESANLDGVIRGAMKPFCDDTHGQVRIEGEIVQVNPQMAVALAMVIHELASNAARYGALSTPDGKLEVRWQVRGRTLDLRWCEFDGPPVRPPSTRGFGTRLLARWIGGELGGTSELAFEAAGLKCRIGVPLIM